MKATLKTIGKIAGGVGTLLVCTSIITLLITSGSLLLFGVKLTTGVALLVLWAFTNGEGLSSWAKSAFFYSSSLVMGLLFVALLGAANYIVARRSKTWDLTNKQVYSLSAQTLSTLRELKEPVRVIAFVENGPPEAVAALFKRYQAESEAFSFAFKDPHQANDLTQKYQIRQGQPAAVLVRGSGEHERYQVLNLTRLGDAQQAEQELTNGLVKLDAVGAQKLYFLEGHGEWPLTPVGTGEDAARASLQVKRVLEDEGYAPEPLNLITTQDIPADTSALVIAGARSKLSAPELTRLEDFLAKGGRLLYFTEPGAENDLDALLAKYGVEVEPGLVADAKVNPEQPYLVIAPFLGEHEITTPLAKAKLNVVFATTRALTLLRSGTLPGVTTTPLVLTTPYAWIETSMAENPTYDPGERTGQLTLAAASTRPTADVAGKRSDEARLLVFGDSELLVGAFGLEPNRNLVMNSFAWATQQSKKLTIRPPDRDVSSVDLTPAMMANIRLLSIDLLPTLLIGIGLTIWLTRRAR
jgi:ABC-type uncharacterized transport system involved in gliding motility auxiliary subunit